MLAIVVLPTLSLHDTYKRTPPHFVLLFVCGFTIIFLASGLGVEDQQIAFM